MICFLEKLRFPVAANGRGNRCGNRCGNRSNLTAARLFMCRLPKLPQFIINIVVDNKRGNMDTNTYVKARIRVYRVSGTFAATEAPESLQTSTAPRFDPVAAAVAAAVAGNRRRQPC